MNETAVQPRSLARRYVVLSGFLILLSLAAAVAGYKLATRTPAMPNIGLPRGAVAPDFSLFDSHSRRVRLYDETAKGPVLVVFYLGYTCPRCVAHLREMEARYGDFERAGVRIVAVSGDLPVLSRQRQVQFGELPFPLLSDQVRLVASQYRVYQGDDRDFHAVFLVDSANTVQFVSAGEHPIDDLDPILKAAAALKGRAP